MYKLYIGDCVEQYNYLCDAMESSYQWCRQSLPNLSLDHSVPEDDLIIRKSVEGGYGVYSRSLSEWLLVCRVVKENRL